MKKKQEIDTYYYENNCLVEEFMEAERKGELLRPCNGKNAIAMMRESSSPTRHRAYAVRSGAYGGG
jgi:hypothetical protein